MVNEITVTIFTVMVIMQLSLAVLTFILKQDGYAHIYVALLSTILGFVNANIILNGNVVTIISDGITYSYLPMQSLPIHYFLLAVSLTMLFITVMLAVKLLKDKAEKDSTFSAMSVRSDV